MKQEGFERIKKCSLQNRMLGHENITHVLGIYDSGVKGVLPVLVMERLQDNVTSQN